ncbi:PQQ-dependent sugar dehydrogenase [Pseudogemmatithrix spongiicola]|uniref:PQQ-dependent sugar dehydrogenase n=1 Tax=Pseudogemmatithrix spongiicola TaxID=3062599 RepID=A0AA49Q765_9BACT|nr:PQQ-dependent sugar dehydrogenase [Gemmatimonadaceae bacterium 'strain 138']WKW14456.1 PQQ-dependent sugar dehydrogenase [Gemmatimonadaceae bacterium 'strain 318']
MSIRLLSAAALAGVLLAPSLPAQDAPLRSIYHPYRVVTVAEGLVNPWSIAFLPGGDILVTERAGRLRIVRGGRLLAEPVAGLPAIRVGNQGGLLDVVPHPDFARNRLLYISYAKPNAAGDQSTTAVIRARFANDRLNDVQEVFEANAWSRGQGHYGSRIAFDGKGYMFITVGDRQVPPQGDLAAHPAQDLKVHNGKVIRLHDDGRVPTDNPFVGRTDALPQIWSYGHRNPQGLLIDAAGNVWATEHGPQGGDELNLIQPGKNYGWPVIGFGVNYRSGTNIHEGTTRAGMEQPVKVWVPSIATSGLMQYRGTAFSGWQGHVFSGGLVGEVLWRLKIEDGRVVEEEQLFSRRGRVRDVRQGPDGFVYLAVEDRAGGPTNLVRLEPAGR